MSLLVLYLSSCPSSSQMTTNTFAHCTTGAGAPSHKQQHVAFVLQATMTCLNSRGSPHCLCLCSVLQWSNNKTVSPSSGNAMSAWDCPAVHRLARQCPSCKCWMTPGWATPCHRSPSQCQPPITACMLLTASMPLPQLALPYGPQ